MDGPPAEVVAADVAVVGVATVDVAAVDVVAVPLLGGGTWSAPASWPVIPLPRNAPWLRQAHAGRGFLLRPNQSASMKRPRLRARCPCGPWRSRSSWRASNAGSCHRCRP